MENKKQSPPKCSGKEKLRLIWRFLDGSKRYFLLTMLLTALVSLLELINPKIIGFAIDSVIGDKPSQYGGFIGDIIDRFGGVEELKSKIWIIAIAVTLISVLALILRYLYRVCNSVAAENLVLNMRNTLFAHILRLPFKWHGENQTGDIIQRCTSDVDMVKRFLSDQLTSVLRIVILITMSLTFMFSMNVTLAIIAMASIPVIVLYSAIFHKHISKNFAACDEAEGKLSAIAQENLTGVRVVRAFGREEYERERFKKQSGRYADLWIKLNKLFSLFWGTGDAISGLQVMLIVVVGTVICARGEMSVGDFVAFISYNAMLIWPVRMLGRVISQMSQAGIAIDRIAYVMNAEAEKDRDTATAQTVSGDIVFDDVTFSYDGKKNILENVSITIPEGTTCGILGSTGSGKSTLMYLLDRLYELTDESGKITIGGVDIRDIPMSTLRSNVGMVMQEPFLFSRTIAENIGITGVNSEEEIRRAAKIACLDDTVESFTDGYETIVGERGVTLSGGQKQRTAIARMLTRNTHIMIFDDSLSAVDAETDAKIRRALREKTADATVILISHRASTLMHADNIIVMDKGRVTDSGTHSELVSRDGLYKRIYEIQMQSREEAGI